MFTIDSSETKVYENIKQEVTNFAIKYPTVTTAVSAFFAGTIVALGTPVATTIAGATVVKMGAVATAAVVAGVAAKVIEMKKNEQGCLK